MASELEPCPFCSKTMMLRSALWPSEGDADAIIHADPTDCPMLGFSDGSADGSIIEKWNCSLSNEDDLPSDGSCVRCGSVPRNANGLCNTCLDEDAERLENTRTTPVAPVSPDTDGKCGELVTVAKQHRLIRGGYPGSWQPYASPIFSDDVFETRELVTRSQAEELLAAERVKYEAIVDSLRIQLDRVNALEADNAAKDARIKELEWKAHNATISNKIGEDSAPMLWSEYVEALEAKLATANALVTCCCGDPVDAHNMGSGHSPIDQYHYKMMQLKAKLAAAEKALEPFAKIPVSTVPEGRLGHVPDKHPCMFDLDGNVLFTASDIRKARAVLGGKPL